MPHPSSLTFPPLLVFSTFSLFMLRGLDFNPRPDDTLIICCASWWAPNQWIRWILVGGVVCGASANRIYHLLSISKVKSCAKHLALHQIKKWPTGGLSALFVPMGHDANCFLTLLQRPSNYTRQLEWRGVYRRSESLFHWSLLCAFFLSLLNARHWVRYSLSKTHLLYLLLYLG